MPSGIQFLSKSVLRFKIRLSNLPGAGGQKSPLIFRRLCARFYSVPQCTGCFLALFNHCRFAIRVWSGPEARRFIARVWLPGRFWWVLADSRGRGFCQVHTAQLGKTSLVLPRAQNHKPFPNKDLRFSPRLKTPEVLPRKKRFRKRCQNPKRGGWKPEG